MHYSEVLVGDIVELKAGILIPADGILVSSTNGLQVDEQLVTKIYGEYFLIIIKKIFLIIKKINFPRTAAKKYIVKLLFITTITRFNLNKIISSAIGRNYGKIVF